MAELDKVLYNLVEPMVDDKDSLRVEKETREGSDEVVLRVYAKNGDIARLIGRKGAMASSLRQVMSVASHADGSRISIKFQEID
ncbi:MAG: KH domain-containing protein [Galactobacillus timonensis]|jgi:predicted RNA-binding protein YlqC (UPF0109 family)|uniref:KH domain-containing protein n=1 Tax=Galactobacillus timonensis TaxID=2041840 RepID=UPI000C820C1B|nr:KH domain-containing protein [Galactobacillus timonensis]MDY5222508.1 KH domain-containing protein [Lachnospiraceae bacterium]MDY6281812.1 KH domain-containing protein [Erysipelotrichaceae bacterium]MCI6068075.1 KH domain-containing protein [Galactobacillus timonensis]MCI6753594.1 KH domain-containing protein [Galactobacillus timonensis]MDD5852219.1 KH domain-containing protein [Galactobacillus timonensis]